MRVSTAQFYFQNTRQITDKQSDVNQQVGYMSSGKQVLTAKDDPVSYSTLKGFEDEQKRLEKYQRNITQAESRNNLQEVTLSNANDLMQQMKQLVIQGNNGTLSDNDIKSLIDRAKNIQDQMLDIANTKDETGSFIFSGYQTDQQPFSLQLDGTVQYSGDNGVREVQIANNLLIQTNQAGDDVFQDVKNAIGDFSPVYISNTSGISVNSAKVVNPSVNDPITNPANYKFSFSSATDLTVTDGNGTPVYTTTSYSNGQTIAFNGIEVQLDGNPLPGDEFDLAPEEKIGVFETLQTVVDWLENSTTVTNPELHQANYREVLTQLDGSLNHLLSRQAEAGVRLGLIDSQKNKHLDTEVILAKSESRIEDLDYAKAVGEFEQAKVALQAAQQTFVQIRDLSLFNYI